jgi:hypothetical protein
MSKQSEAKAKQAYVEKPLPRTCSTCAHLTVDLELPAWMKKAGCYDHDPRYLVETNRRCSIGGFAVKRTATCQLWLKKAEA